VLQENIVTLKRESGFNYQEISTRLQTKMQVNVTGNNLL